jgi:hypothetical protein
MKRLEVSGAVRHIYIYIYIYIYVIRRPKVKVIHGRAVVVFVVGRDKLTLVFYQYLILVQYSVSY